jgi:hypothetical protein
VTLHVAARDVKLGFRFDSQTALCLTGYSLHKTTTHTNITHLCALLCDTTVKLYRNPSAPLTRISLHINMVLMNYRVQNNLLNAMLNYKY